MTTAAVSDLHEAIRDSTEARLAYEASQKPLTERQRLLRQWVPWVLVLAASIASGVVIVGRLTSAPEEFTSFWLIVPPAAALVAMVLASAWTGGPSQPVRVIRAVRRQLSGRDPFVAEFAPLGVRTADDVVQRFPSRLTPVFWMIDIALIPAVDSHDSVTTVLSVVVRCLAATVPVILVVECRNLHHALSYGRVVRALEGVTG